LLKTSRKAVDGGFLRELYKVFEGLYDSLQGRNP
jgi:hypothetical protein